MPGPYSAGWGIRLPTTYSNAPNFAETRPEYSSKVREPVL
jgi:hypothetical protein